MHGAELRAQQARALAWAGALLPYQKKLPRFEDFVGIKQRGRGRGEWVRDFEAKWDRVDAALRRKARA